MSPHKKERVTLRMPKGLLDEIETLVDRGIYPNRSEAIRDSSRRLVLELETEDRFPHKQLEADGGES